MIFIVLFKHQSIEKRAGQENGFARLSTWKHYIFCLFLCGLKILIHSGFFRIISDPDIFICSDNWKTRKMASKTNPFTFLQQVRQEVAKVTWPTRRETIVTTLMVFVMILLAAFFFLAVDQILSWIIGVLLEFGN